MLTHQLSTIPEATQLRELTARRKTARQRAARPAVQVDDITAEQKRADADVEQVKTRRDRDQGDDRRRPDQRPQGSSSGCSAS